MVGLKFYFFKINFGLYFVAIPCFKWRFFFFFFFFCNAFVGSLFNRNIAVFIVSSQNLFGCTLWWRKQLVISIIVMFFLSTTIFLLRNVRCNQLVFNAHNFSKFIKFSRGIFSFFVRLYHLHFASTLISTKL